jgi:hypothetical protein
MSLSFPIELGELQERREIPHKEEDPAKEVHAQTKHENIRDERRTERAQALAAAAPCYVRHRSYY